MLLFSALNSIFIMILQFILVINLNAFFEAMIDVVYIIIRCSSYYNNINDYQESKNEGSCFYDISYDVQKPEVEKKERQITVKKKIYY
jgi:hypothetical protein